MKLITFDAFRTLGIPGVRYIKPERMLDHLDEVRAADILLFPEYWQITTLVYGLGKRIFPSLPSYAIGHDKVEQTRVFQAICPDNVPPTEIRGASRQAIDDIEARFGYPLIVKEVKSSMGVGVKLIQSRGELEAHAAEHPVLYAQPRLEIDRDLRIVVVGGEVITAYWRVTPLGGYRSNVSQGGETAYDNIPAPAIALALHLADALSVDHAGFDIAMVDGHPLVFEFNRLFGNQGIPDSSRRIGAAILRHLALDSSDNDPTPPLLTPRRVRRTTLKETG